MLLAVAGCATAVAVLLGTATGAGWLARIASSQSAGMLRFEEVRGSLATGLQVGVLDISAGESRIRIEDLELVLHMHELLRGRLRVQRLAAARAVVELGASAGDAGPFVMPTVRAPIPVSLREFSLPLLELRRDGQAWTLTGLHAAGRLWGSRLLVREARAEHDGLFVRIAGRARLQDPLPLALRVGWSLPARQLSGAGTLRGDLRKLEVAQALRLPEAAILHASLHELAGSPRIEAEASWGSLERVLPGLGRVASAGGRLQLDGGLDAWQARLDASLAGERWPSLSALARLRGSGAHAVIEQAVARGGFGEIGARGVADLSGPVPRWRIDAVARDVRTEAFRRGLEGRFSGRLHATGLPDGAIELDVLALDGRLMGRPLAGTGRLRLHEGTLGFSKLALRAGANRLSADGSVGQRLAGRIELDAPELALLWPGLSGSLSARASLAGSPARPVIDLDAEGRELALDARRLAGLQLRAKVDRSGRADITLAARGLQVDGQALGELVAEVAGSLDDHRLRASLAGGPVVAMLESRGSWQQATLRHEISAASLGMEGPLGSWRLAGRPLLVAGAGRAGIGSHCWEQPPAALCISEARWAPHDGRLVASLRRFGLSRFDDWLGRNLAVEGEASVDLSFALTAEGPEASFRWWQEGTAIHYTEGEEPLTRKLPVVALDASLTPLAGEARLGIEGENGLRLEGEARMPMPLGPEAPLDLRLAGEFPELALLAPLLAAEIELAELAGRITLDVRADGSLAAPRLQGSLRLVDGGVALSDLGVKFEDVQLALLGDGSDTLRLEGRATVGGALGIEGELQPLAAGGPRGWLQLRGDRLDAIRLPDRQVQVSPDLRVDYAAGSLGASGRIRVPRAEIIVRELPESAVSPSRDAVVHERPPRPGESAITTAIGGEVEVELGREVHLEGFGLETHLEGSLKLSQAPDRTPRGFGVLRLREGRFGAYGKELVIERGTLGFAGPLDDPAVDIRATRRVDYEGRQVVAGIQLSGTASRPQSQVFSEPAMSQADALSFLVTGHPLQVASSGEQSAVAGAVLALGVQQTSPITDAIGHAVTLDELALAGGNTLEETQLVAGKRLGSDLYLRFSYGLFNRIGTVLARYRLNRNFSIEAASGEDQSLDLVYSVERD